MPELPEVETIKRDLENRILHHSIEEVSVRDTMVVRFPSKKLFIKQLEGKHIEALERRGKAIIFKLSGGYFLIIQLVMTGQLIFGKKSPHARVSFKLSNGEYLNYNDQRRFGRLNVVRNLNELKFFKSLGPEPFDGDFNAAWLTKELKKHKVPIKSLLMNQSFVAGIGNIYANEILFRCGINPQRPGRSLRPEEIKTLHKMTILILKKAIELRGSSVNTYRDANGQKGFFINRLKVYGKAKDKCVLCKAPIERIVLAGRSTFFCRRCQS